MIISIVFFIVMVILFIGVVVNFSEYDIHNRTMKQAELDSDNPRRMDAMYRRNEAGDNAKSFLIWYLTVFSFFLIITFI